MYSVGVSFIGLSVDVGVIVEESGTTVEGVESDAGPGVEVEEESEAGIAGGVGVAESVRDAGTALGVETVEDSEEYSFSESSLVLFGTSLSQSNEPNLSEISFKSSSNSDSRFSKALWLSKP
jgi:hypothetical protein